MITMKNNNKIIKNIAVIGGGASGMISALFARYEADRIGVDTEISIYERNPRIGKKILVTGNGRCNFSNENMSADNYHGDSDFAFGIVNRFNYQDTVAFFRRIGVLSKADAAGRIYPMSFQASSVLDALRAEIDKCNIRLICDNKITSIKCVENGFLLNGSFFADACILACGAKAASVHGSDGSGFELLNSFGIDIAPVLPALTALVCDNFPKGLKGIRAQGKIEIKSGGKLLASDTGEIQYTDYGLSGIPSMQVSGEVSRTLNSTDTPVFAFVDACPYISASELYDHLMSYKKHNPGVSSEYLLSGIVPKKLGLTFLVDCSINPAKNIGILHPSVVEKIVSVIKSKKYKIKSVRSFNDAQVCCGGIRCSEVNGSTLELKKVPGLFVCGEMLNVDGDCGGYNLQWAWSSGYVAGINAVREIVKC